MNNKKSFLKTWYGKTIGIIVAIIVVLFLFMQFFYEPVFEWYTGVKNGELTYDSSKKLTDEEFEATAKELIREERLAAAEKLTANEKDEAIRRQKINMLLNTRSFQNQTKFKHIKYFRDAGIRQYKGPETCLKCHETMKVTHADGSIETVNTMDDVVNSIHFTFMRKVAGFTTYGFDGRKVNEGSHKIPIGKIDRACGIPGSFSWTGWAALVKSYPNGKNGKVVYRSEGCGQCHIGGNYQPATEKMMPFGDVPEEAKEGIDCLICHSQTYDMNYKYVIKDDVGYRWNEDRTLKSAMAVTKPTNYNCLTCHQHDLGGDVYKYNDANKHLGYKNKRILHVGTKRGTPFSPHDDVHAAAGMNCLDCHVPEGHKIPRGTGGVDLISNDLPGKKVSCESCHTDAPHSKNPVTSAILNGHTAKLACETCHIKDLEPENVVLRDWVNPTWSEEEGLYTPTDIVRSGKVNVGYNFYWFNGNGSFLAGALGANPDFKNETSKYYNTYMNQFEKLDPKIVKAASEGFDKYLAGKGLNKKEYMKDIKNTLTPLSPELLKQRKEMIAKNMIPLQKMGNSKIYPFKIFNAKMYEDMSNSGPFGAMILPFDYPTYYETGNSLASVKKAIENPIIKRMYQYPFKVFMMDEFMYYFGVKEWSDVYPIDDNGNLRNVEPHWMRQNANLMINHGIVKDGRKCSDCHSPNGIMNFEQLGYSKEKAKELRNLKVVKYFEKVKK